MSSWEKFVKKYVWDDQSTPFLVPVARLHRGQADKELFLFAMFLGTPFALILLWAAARFVETGGYGYLGIGLYALSVLAAVAMVRMHKNWLAAPYCLTAPLAILLRFVVSGFPEGMQALDQALVLIMLIAWMRYTVRIVEIARAYDGLPAPPPRGG